MVKHLSTMQETQVRALGWEDPLEKEMAIHSSTIAQKIPWTEVCNIVQDVVTNTIPKQKKCKKTKWLSEEALKIAEARREVKSKGERER